jgi:hypothetical protein
MLTLPPGAFKTFQARQVSDTEVRTACEDAGCRAWRLGWSMRIDESTPLGMARASYIRWQSGRTFKELRDTDGATVFRFEPGERCFQEHYTHPELYLVRGGDARRLQGLIRRHANAADLVEDMQETFDAVREDRARG